MTGIGELVKTVGSGIGKIYDDAISIPLNMRRIKSNTGVELEITESGYKLKKNNQDIEFTDLEFDTQQEILKLKNQVGALNNLFLQLDKSLNSTEETMCLFNKITEADKLYLLEKFKYEDDVEKINTINNIISEKLLSDNNFSRKLFDFVMSLTKADIINLGKIKKLILSYSVVRHDNKDNVIKSIIPNNEGVLRMECENHMGMYFPYMTGDNVLKKLPLNLNWSTIQEYAYRGLYSESSMSRTFSSTTDAKNIYLFRYDKNAHMMLTNFNEVKGNIFLISNFGHEVLSYIPIYDKQINYIEFINENKLLPCSLKKITDKDYKDLINEMNNI